MPYPDLQFPQVAWEFQLVRKNDRETFSGGQLAVVTPHSYVPRQD